MANRFFAIRVDARRVVVAEVDCLKAASLLDAGSQVFLGTAADLVRLALHLRKDLVTFTRSPANGAGSPDGASLGNPAASPAMSAPAGGRRLAESRVRAKPLDDRATVAADASYRLLWESAQ